jgi:uncharacterized membrane protein required for colicin V production
MDLIASFSIVDAVALIVIALSMLHGYRRGLSGEVAQLVGVVVALVLGLSGYQPTAAWLAEKTRLTEQSAWAVAFVAIVLGSSLVLITVRYLLGRVMKVVFNPAVDKVGGVVSGFLRSSLCVLILFIVMTLVPHSYLNRMFGERSMIGQLTLKLMPVVHRGFEEHRDDVRRMVVGDDARPAVDEPAAAGDEEP